MGNARFLKFTRPLRFASKRMTVFLALAFIALLVFLEKRSVGASFQHSVAIWETEIATAVLNNDFGFAEKITRSLFSTEITFIELTHPQGVMTSFPKSISQVACPIPVQVPIQRYGIQLGSMKGCLSFSAIAKRAILSPFLFVLLVFLFIATELGRREKRRAKTQLAVANQLSQLARQVAHDIRSPLAALDTASIGLTELPERQRLLIRSAVARIHDIANGLLDTYRGGRPVTSPSRQLELHSLTNLTENLVSEKRLQFRSRLNTEIRLDLDPHSLGAFAKVDAGSFKRILSNLINNSVEHSRGSAQIVVSIQKANSVIRMSVHDNGNGIPAEILAKLTTQEITYGKEKGNGIGLFHAGTTIRAWGGDIKIDSKLGAGTTVTIELPGQSPPKWFVDQIFVQADTEIVIVDDDISIHEMWQQRIEEAPKKLTTRHCASGEEFVSWWMSQAKTPEQKRLVLIDYELAKESQSGLDLIQELGIANSSILVTSHAEERPIVTRCEALGVKVMPKSMVGLIPIVEASSISCDCVLIDDNPVGRMAWDFAATRTGRTLRTYSSMEEFLSMADKIPHETPIYLDWELSTLGLSGEKAAEQLAKAGFTNIIVATGYEASSLPTMPYVSGVVGKEPPWK